jgi:hypothetical protein
VIQDATDFAASMGMVAIPLDSKETPVNPGHFATFDYQFRVVDKTTPKQSGHIWSLAQIWS